MRNDRAYLLDVLLAERDALDFASGLTRSGFERSRLHQNAIIKCIEVIGEAASRLSGEFKETHQEIAWHEVVGMRHRLVHAYFDIDLGVLWKTVQDDLPALGCSARTPRAARG